MKQRIFKVLLAVAVLTAHVSAGNLAFACEMHGEVHRTCCCGGEAPKINAGARAQQDSCACCEIKTADRAPASLNPVVQAAADSVAPASFARVHLAPVPMVADGDGWFDWRVRAYKTTPLFLLNRSLLT
jgi:hypothetical protein